MLIKETKGWRRTLLIELHAIIIDKFKLEERRRWERRKEKIEVENGFVLEKKQSGNGSTKGKREVLGILRKWNQAREYIYIYIYIHTWLVIYINWAEANSLKPNLIFKPNQFLKSFCH